MKKYIFAVTLLLIVNCQLSIVHCEDVVRLNAAVGTDIEYSVTELLRVELMGDSIRFIGTDGTPVAEVYKYDYVKLTIEDKPTGIEPVTGNPSPLTAQKILINGQVYILFGDKAYRIDGTQVR